MVICAGHNHAPPQRNLDGHLLAPQPAHGGPAGSHHPRLAAQQPIHQTFNRQPRLFLALDRRSLVADQYQPIWRPGENPRCAGRQGAAVEARASRSTYDPAGDSGRRHLDEHSPDPRCPREDLVHWPQPHYMLRCRPCLGVPVHDHVQPVRDRWSRSSTSSATAQGWTSSDKIPLGGRSKVGKSIVEDVVDRQDLRTVSRLPSYPADIA